MKKLRVLILLFLITIIISSCNQTTQQGRYQMFKSRWITKDKPAYGSSTVTYREGDGEYVYIFDTQTGNITVLFRPTERKRIYKISDYKHE